MSTFYELGLSPELAKLLEEKGYQAPTPIQEQIIPAIIAGSDILACAPTGTGKTAAFSLPMIQILSQSPAKARVPRSLILVPTRELAHQVADNFKTYSVNHRMNVAVLIGGESIVQQQKILLKGVDVLIATPGRFLDLYQSGRILLNGIKIVVLDESDRMMDMGFMPSIKKIMAALPSQKQTVLLSATMPNEIRKLSQEFLRNPKEVTVERTEASHKSIVQQAIFIHAPKSPASAARKAKEPVLLALLRKYAVESSIIFCNRKIDVDKVHAFLKKNGYAVEAMHGDFSQSQRNRALERIKNQTSAHLVASDVAARGIDITDLPVVINFDVPIQLEDYVHRIGRTGRAGSTGHAFTFVADGDKSQFRAIEKHIGKKIEILHDVGPGSIPAESGSSSHPQDRSSERLKHTDRPHRDKPRHDRPRHDKSPTSNARNEQRHQPRDAQKKTHTPADSSPKIEGKDKHDKRSTPPSQPSSTTKGFGDDVPSFLKF